MTNFLRGSTRLFNNHSVCTTCGAMVDNDFLAAHAKFHDTPIAGKLTHMG